MSTLPKNFISAERYLQIERTAEQRSEYYRGEMFALAGASRRHNLIAGNVFGSLHFQLKQRPCEVYQSDMRVKVSTSGLYTYPDVVATCAEPRFEDEHGDTLLNPQAIVEVLSASTEAWDRGRKFEHYRAIPALSEYVLISQDRCHVERHSRQFGGQWLLWETSNPDDVLTFESLECTLPIAELYAKVNLDEATD